MANIFWKGKKAPASEVQKYIMEKAESALGGKANFGFRIEEGSAELWIECLDPNDASSTYWHILDNKPKILGWRTLIFKCPTGYLTCFEKHKNIKEICLMGEEEIKSI